MWIHIKETSKSALLTLCEGNSTVTGEFPTQRASNDKKASIWWRHHEQVELKTQHNITSAASDHKVAGATTSLFWTAFSQWRAVRAAVPRVYNHNWTIYKHGDIGTFCIHPSKIIMVRYLCEKGNPLISMEFAGWRPPDPFRTYMVDYLPCNV